MWEDILKLREYELGDERRSSGKVAFKALDSIVKDLRNVCNSMGIGFSTTHGDNSYLEQHDSDYYRMLERLNSVIYSMSMQPELYELGRESQRRRGREIYTRRANVHINSRRMRISFSTYSIGRKIYNVNMGFGSGLKKLTNEELRVFKRRLRAYFKYNFDNGTLDVESLVNNIFNHLGLTVEEETEREPELEPEGTVREKWWQ